MLFLGIDPGASGGLAFLDLDGDGSAVKMPETEADTWALVRRDQWFGKIDFAIIEHVHSMPKQGVSSSFKFGRSYGFLRGLLVASGIPFEEVSPQTWQKALNCRSGGDKNVTKARAQQLFPGNKITHATADALLLAEYGRRLWISRYGQSSPSASHDANPNALPGVPTASGKAKPTYTLFAT